MVVASVKVTAILVTRGNVPYGEVTASIAAAPSVAQVVIWDNSKRENLSVYGRYAGLVDADHDVIYVQDDDCLVDVERVIAAYEPGRLVANMPRSRWDDYPDSTLVGWGAVFDRGLPGIAFWKYETYNLFQGSVDAFRRDCDLVFSALTPRTVIDADFEHLPWAETQGRLFKQAGHAKLRATLLAECRRIRTWPDDDRRG